MSLVWIESFVGWSTPVGIYQLPAVPAAPGVANGPNGQNTYFLDGNGPATLPVLLVGTPATVGIGVRFKSVASGTHMGLYDAATEQIHVQTDVLGRVQVLRGATILGQSAIGTIIFGLWYYMTLDATIDGAAGSAVVAVDGVVVVNVAGVNTKQSANAYATTARIIGGGIGGSTVCDYYVTDGVVAGAEPVATIGDVRVVALRPSGVGSNAQFAPSAGANWQNVDDAPTPDGDATYNASATVGQIDTFATTDLAAALVVTTIPAVFVKTYGRKDDAGVRSLAAAVKLGANTVAAAGVPSSAGYAWQADKFATDPAGAAWTKANVNAAEFGYKLIA